ncbi:arylsulfatase A-like enzyme [Kribbella sp. VKM Ac-2571]|uniref:sulfatase family protein n=1 Tax=Kribbella sp. VKM Ac-2571 TaxID=2512222 RepID=UPI00105DC118|nr:sulfatase-like hydrolase/transferase [Kribbella sp. VKM Ac-2571]TDO51142.1 arylsulfatase A-like enzyme [Kribbella sp. VKM Ac-2571]
MRPNVLLLCTDQQRFSALGASGNDEIETPNLDRLASQGVLFENCYVQNPVCGPSRASLMTGRFVHQHGLWANGVGLPDHERLFSKDLADAGYDCGLVGKFHLNACFGGRSEKRHDDGFRVFRWAHDPYPGSSENEYHRWLHTVRPDLAGAEVDYDTLPAELHYSHWIGEQTIDFLTHSRDREKPFLFVANFFDPHHGFGAPEDYVRRYRDKELSRPLPDDLTGKPPIQTEASHESYAGHARGFTSYSPEELQEVKAAYYAMVTLVDEEVGRILDALDAEGLSDDTLVIFTSDHGEMLGDHQLMLKGPMMYDEAVRVPLILRRPSTIPAGTRNTELVQWIDLGATILAAAGLQPLGEGQDLLPLATNRATGRGWAVSEYRNSGHPYATPVHLTMLRRDHWKLIVQHGSPATDRERTGELYDLAADPNELQNLWDDPLHRDIRTELQEFLLDVLVATEDRSQERVADW